MEDMQEIAWNAGLPQGSETQEHNLLDLLKAWQLPEQFCRGVSERWRCKVAQLATGDDDLCRHVLREDPVFLSPSYARRAFEQVGSDALDYLIDDPERNEFPRQKIAFVAGAANVPRTTAPEVRRTGAG